MELKLIITLTLIGISSLLLQLKPSECHQLLHFQSSFDDHYDVQANNLKISIPFSLPRKLRQLLTETTSTTTVEGLGDKHSATSYSMPQENFPGKVSYKTRAGGVADSSEFLTMDYPWIRRRRPIHNQAMPTP